MIPSSPPHNLQVLKTWHGLCDIRSSPSPSSIWRGSRRTGRVCARIPLPSFLTLHLGAALHVLFGYQLSPDILVPSPRAPWKDLLSSMYSNHYLLTFSLPPNERQSVSESLERYLWCCQNDSSGRRVVSPFVLFICPTYSYQLWRLLHTRKYHH